MALSTNLYSSVRWLCVKVVMSSTVFPWALSYDCQSFSSPRPAATGAIMGFSTPVHPCSHVPLGLSWDSLHQFTRAVMSFWGYRVILYTSSPVQSCTSGAIVGFSTPVHPCSHVPLELLASFRVLDPIESTVQLQLGSGGQSSRVFMFCHRRWDSGTRSLIICVCFQNHRMC